MALVAYDIIQLFTKVLSNCAFKLLSYYNRDRFNGIALTENAKHDNARWIGKLDNQSSVNAQTLECKDRETCHQNPDSYDADSYDAYSCDTESWLLTNVHYCRDLQRSTLVVEEKKYSLK